MFKFSQAFDFYSVSEKLEYIHLKMYKLSSSFSQKTENKHWSFENAVPTNPIMAEECINLVLTLFFNLYLKCQPRLILLHSNCVKVLLLHLHELTACYLAFYSQRVNEKNIMQMSIREYDRKEAFAFFYKLEEN